MIDTTISHYRVLEKLGAGGMGVVYKAQDIRLGRFVALKFLPEDYADDNQLRGRFQREARAASALNHQNICTIYDIGEEDERVFMAMEFLDGETLKAKAERGPLELNYLLNVSKQVLDGLDAAHSERIIHRDIKPANIFIMSKNRVKILDFGLAKITTSARVVTGEEQMLVSGSAEYMTTGGGALGTMPYMSPEQALGKPLDTRTDLFSFGVTLYEMATGKVPFQGDSTGTLFLSIVQDTPVPAMQLNRDVVPELQRIIDRCLEKNRDLRYQHASDIAVDLIRLRQEAGVSWAGSASVSDAVAAAVVGRQITPPARPAPSAATPASARSQTPQRPSQVAPRPPQPLASEAVAKAVRRRGIAWSAAAVLLLALAVGGFFYWRPHRTAPLTSKDTILLADFTNATDDPVFGGSLRQALAVELEQSPFLSLVSDQRIQQILTMMNQPKDARLTPEISRDLCERAGSAGVLTGAIAQIGTRYLLTLEAVNCTTGQSLAIAAAQASDKNHVLDALASASSEMRTKLGESRATVTEFNAPLEQVTTPSLEALQAFSRGWNANDKTASIALFQEAIRLDPNFAMAYASLGTIYYNMGEKNEAARNTVKAYELRQRVSERERFYIDSHYHERVTGNLEEARRVFQLWARTYPRDWVPPNNLGITYFNLGQYDEAFQSVSAALQLNPGGRLVHANTVNALLYLNRVDEAKAAAEEAKANGLDSPFLHSLQYEIAFLQSDASGMARQVAWSAGKPAIEDVLLAQSADTAAYSGQLNRALELSRQAVASAQRSEQKETAASYEAQAALREALVGNIAQARKLAEAALTHSTGRDVQYGGALALGLAGDVPRVEKLATDLAKRFPEDTLVQFNYLPTLYGQLALNRSNSAEAVSKLQAAGPFDLSTTTVHFNFVGLYPVFVRGQAFLLAHQGSEAVSEFQKILDHRGVVADLPIGALARLGLARAYVLQNDSAKARTAYDDFLALWKDADPDVPILKQAKAEYAKLQ